MQRGHSIDIWKDVGCPRAPQAAAEAADRDSVAMAGSRPKRDP